MKNTARFSLAGGKEERKWKNESEHGKGRWRMQNILYVLTFCSSVSDTLSPCLVNCQKCGREQKERGREKESICTQITSWKQQGQIRGTNWCITAPKNIFFWQPNEHVSHSLLCVYLTELTAGVNTREGMVKKKHRECGVKLNRVRWIWTSKSGRIKKKKKFSGGNCG